LTQLRSQHNCQSGRIAAGARLHESSAVFTVFKHRKRGANNSNSRLWLAFQARLRDIGGALAAVNANAPAKKMLILI